MSSWYSWDLIGERMFMCKKLAILKHMSCTVLDCKKKKKKNFGLLGLEMQQATENISFNFNVTFLYCV